jgi:ATP-dependent exoDNAse (exonuclease V) beta subunit
MRTRDEATLWLPGVEWSGAARAPEPADIEQRRRALAPASSFIVQAPAGSGKTELLIQRYLALLAQVAQPEAVVAITFTVKAAGEMRSRVLDALRNAAQQAEPSSEHERLTQQLARQALARDSKLGWDLLNQSGRLRIQTIDALSMAITRQMPWLARFGAMPGVTDDAREMYREAAGRAVEMLGDGGDTGAAVASLLRHLDNGAARAITLLAGMLETRDHWLRALGTGGDPEQARRALETSLRRIVSAHLEKLYDSAPAYCAGELLELLRYAASNVSGGDPAIAGCAGLAAIPEGRPECTGLWLGFRRMLLTNDGEWRKRVDRSIGFPPHNRRMKDRLDALLRLLAPAEEFRRLLAALPDLPSSAYDEGQWEALSALFRLLPVTVAHLRAVFSATGKVDFIEIAGAARHALVRDEQPTDLALAMGSRIEHLLVDEFQDTSVTQFELLRALTADWELGRGQTLFLVGDPMQSIYRFRQAEVALFLNACQSGIGALRPAPLSLAVNFRSARTVVEWVNQVFQTVFPRQPDAYAGAVPYTPSVAFREGDEGAAVQIHPFLGRDDAGEAELVVNLVRRAQRETPGSRTGILVRSRTHLAAIASALRESAIGYRAVEIQALAEKPVIQDLLALTRALLHLADRVAWLAVLRAPWCGLTLADLHRIAGTDRDRPVWTLLHDEYLAMNPDGAARLSGVLPALSRAMAMRGRMPVAQLVERTWIAMGGDRIAGENELADARAFFELLEETGRDGAIADFERLAGRVKELFANPDPAADGALELMTIHKAKGLEFDNVILPGLGKRPRGDDQPLLLWSERPRGNETDLLMAPIAARRNGNDRTYEFIRRENEGKTRNESLRLLYVACTRARTRLHLIGHVEPDSDPPKDSLLAHIWDVVKPEFERARTNIGAPKAEVPARVPRLMQRVEGGLSPALSPATPLQSRETTEARLPASPDTPARTAGVIIHRLLDRIARDGTAVWNRERLTALRPALKIALADEGVAPGQIESVCDRAVAASIRTIEDPKGRWILAPHETADSEFAITSIIDGEARHLAIDRTFIENGVRWIVDFKTGEPEDSVDAFIEAEVRAHLAQLRQYAAALWRLDRRRIRLGLYFPAIGRWVEC